MTHMKSMSRIARAVGAAVLLAGAVAHGQDLGVPQQRLAPIVLSPQSLVIWSDPEFQRKFELSYIAETDLEPRLTEPERKQMLSIMKQLDEKKTDAAIATLRKNLTPASSAVFDFTLANIYFGNEQFDEAAAAYEVAVRKYEKFRRAWKNLSLIHVRKGDFDKAIPALTKVVELGGGDALTYGLLGFGYSSLEDNLAAESAYRMAILLEPARKDWRMGLARSLFKQERFADAAALCGGMIVGDPDNADLWLLQANAFIGLNQPLRAAENYEIIDRMGRSTSDSLNMLGDIYVNEELFGLAVNCYVRALEMSAHASPDRALRAARVLAARGASADTERLIGSIERSFEGKLTDESRKELLKLHARVAAADGAGDEEARVLEEIVKIDPLDGEALILLGQFHARAKDVERAIFYYERAQKIERHEADAKVRHAQLLVGEGRYAEALPLLRSAQQLKPRDNVQEYLEQVERIAKSKAS